MAKKRKTRAQKERAAARRVEQTEYALNIGEKEPKIVIQKSEPDVKKTAKKLPKTDVNSLQNSWNNWQRHSLKLSLVLLAVIVTGQFVIYLVFRLSLLDSRLYELIKL